jgi:hypothetical protein
MKKILQRSAALLPLVMLACAAACLCYYFGAADVTAVLAFAAAPVIVSDKSMTTDDAHAGSENLLLPNISKKITEFLFSQHPLSKIVDSIPSVTAKSWEHKFYGMGERPLISATVADFTSTGDQVAELQLTDTSGITESNVLMVDALPGYDYATGTERQVGSLKLEVLSVSRGTNRVRVQVVNGQRSGVNYPVPDIAAATQITLLSTSLAEADARGPIVGELPSDEFNYLQKMGVNAEMTTMMKEHEKEVSFNLDFLIRRRLRDMARELEASLLFGSRAIRNSIDKNVPKHYMGGLEFYLANENEFDYPSTLAKFTQQDFSDMLAQTFAGNSGSNKRLMFGGSKFAALLDNSTDIYKNSPSGDRTIVYAGVNFKGIQSNLGEVGFCYHPFFDAIGRKGHAVIIDPEYLQLVRWGGLQMRKLDLRTPGISDVDAVFISQTVSLEVSNRDVHLWIKPV